MTYGGYFERFMESLTQKEQQKVSTRFVKHIRDGIYELRTAYNGNIFRVFFIFDDGNIVVLFTDSRRRLRRPLRMKYYWL